MKEIQKYWNEYVNWVTENIPNWTDNDINFVNFMDWYDSYANDVEDLSNY